MKKILTVVLCAVALAGPARASGLQVIANPGIPVAALNADEIKDIFLGAKTSIGSASVEPVLGQASETHELFLKTYVGKSDQALRNHFKTLVFTGKGAQPKAFANDADVVKYVAATKGAIGYVSESADVSGVKKIQVK